MAATIAKSSCRISSCIHGIKGLQLGIPSKVQYPTVLKDVYRSAWYRSFFQSDQPEAPNKITNSSDTSDALSKPKRPANIFLLYVISVQDRIKQSNPEFSRQQIIWEASRQWRELDPETKAKFAMKRKEMVEKYKEGMMNYMENRSLEQIEMEKKEKEKQEAKKLKKSRKQLGMPKKSLPSFALYMSEKLAERADEPVRSHFKQAKENWNQMSEHEKEVYHMKAMESQEQYKKNMADWEEQMIEMGRFDVIRKATLKKLKETNPRKEGGKGKRGKT